LVLIHWSRSIGGEGRTGTLPYTKTFTYDLAGNILAVDGATFASYDDANKFATVAGGSASYDPDGNLTAIAQAGMPAGTFTWDERDKLASQSHSSNSYDYGYDISGARVWSEELGSARKFYVFDGDRLIGEVSGATPTTVYSWGANGLLNERFIATGLTLWFHFGPQGETRALTDDTGVVTDTYYYSAYGTEIGGTNSHFNPFRYGGGVGYYSEGELGLVLAGARWYSVAQMRWLTRDPIGYEGDANLYRYVRNRPVRYLDPDGLDAVAVSPGGLAAIGEAIKDVGAGALAGAGSAAAVIGTGFGAFGAGALVYCVLNQDDCLAAYEGYLCSNETSKKPDRGWGANLPNKGGPRGGSLADGAGDEGTIRDYDENGDAIRDYDFGHNHKPNYPGDPHAHDWAGGRRGGSRPLLPGE
jgi:RHS repeat-associated protein